MTLAWIAAQRRKRQIGLTAAVLIAVCSFGASLASADVTAQDGSVATSERTVSFARVTPHYSVALEAMHFVIANAIRQAGGYDANYLPAKLDRSLTDTRTGFIDEAAVSISFSHGAC